MGNSLPSPRPFLTIPAVKKAVMLVFLAGCATMDSGDQKSAIRAVLDAQAEAWNRGDLEAFLEGYAKAGTTVFAGGDRVHRGFDAMAERYRKSYATRERMGKLAFTGLSFESGEADRAVVTGGWELERAGDEKKPGGVFTLIFRKLPEGWRIVHDHTSSR